MRSDAPEHDPGLFGMIAGSWGNVHAGEWAASPEAFPAKALYAQFEATVHEILASRPAVVCSWEGPDARSRFADCFAAAMLSGD